MSKDFKAVKVTIRQIAEQIGVSQSTVSRALAGHPAISSATRDRVATTARQMDYRERSSAVREPPHRMIGVVISALQNQFYVQLLDGLHDELLAQGYHMTLIIDSLSHNEDYVAFEPLLSQYLDGIVFTTASLDNRMVKTLQETGLPVIIAVRAFEGLPFDTVEVDNIVAGRESVRHLIDLGHRNIGFIMGPKETSTSRDRHKGATKYLTSEGIRTDPNLTVWGGYTHASGYSALLTLMQQPQPPTAIVCGNDTIAIGVLEAACKHGFDVPKDLSVIGFDDIPMAGWEMIRLTTIRQPTAEIAATAARRLVGRIRDPGLAPRHDVLPVNLVQRNTTASVRR